MQKKVLVIGPSWVGDMVMAQSLFKQLKQQDPNAVIDVVGPAWSSPIVARMPEVRRAITFDVKHGEFSVAKRWRFGKELRTEGYTHGIVLPRSWKSALPLLAARIPKRTGFVGEMRYVLLNDKRKRDKQKLDQTVKRFVAMALPEGSDVEIDASLYPALKTDEANFQRLIKRLELNSEAPAVAMMPGAEYGPSKQWPVEYFKAVAQQLAAQGKQVWVLGSGKDNPLGEAICEGLPKALGYNLCGATALEDVVDLLAHVETAITNDSGLMHVAAAVGTHVQAIYGSTSPHFTPPLTQNKTIHWLQLDCGPCFKRECPLGHTNCLKQIEPESMLNALKLNGSGEG